jgi:hypothetical protein
MLGPAQCSLGLLKNSRRLQAWSRPRWPESGKFLRFVPDARSCTARRRAVRPRLSAHSQYDRARRAASYQLWSTFQLQRRPEQVVQNGVHLVRKTTSAGDSQHQHPQHTAPARRFRPAVHTHIFLASPHTATPPGHLESHLTHADCTVLDSRATCAQILQGLSCNRRAEASAPSLTLRSSFLGVLVRQEAAEAARRDVESVPRSTPWTWCSTGRV